MRVTEYDERMRELTAKRLKRNVLQVEKSRTELEDSEGYQRLQNDIATLEAEIDEIAEEIGTDDVSHEL